MSREAGEPESGEPMILLCDIDLTLASPAGEVNILRGLSLSVPRGERLGVVGPSGSGKSTMMMIAAGLERPSGGTVRIASRDLAALDEDGLALFRRDAIGIVFQSFHLVSRLSAAGNVELPMIFAGVERSQRRERVARSLEAVGLVERSKHRPEQLSGGERQRVAIARAVVMNPTIVLADEPTGNLDSKTSQEIMAALDQVHAEGNTVILVTHEPDIAKHAHRTVRLHDGRVSEDVRK